MAPKTVPANESESRTATDPPASADGSDTPLVEKMFLPWATVIEGVLPSGRRARVKDRRRAVLEIFRVLSERRGTLTQEEMLLHISCAQIAILKNLMDD